MRSVSSEIRNMNCTFSSQGWNFVDNEATLSFGSSFQWNSLLDFTGYSNRANKYNIEDSHQAFKIYPDNQINHIIDFWNHILLERSGN